MKELLVLLAVTLSPFSHGRDECRQPILNRGVPPQSLVDHLVQWAKKMPDSYFSSNPNNDIYTLAKPKHAPNGWRNLKHRRASAIDSAIVLAAYESSYDWKEGRDWTNTSSGTACTEEAGMWQTSGNTLTGSLYKDMGLKDLFKKSCDEFKRQISNDCRRFLFCTKHDDKHDFATSYTWLVIRKTTLHHGPLIRKKDVQAHLRIKCVEQAEKLL